jgi:regulator of RNase E activity RraB
MLMTIVQLEDTFSKMEAETGWHPRTDLMLWGFFFTHDNKEKFQTASFELSKMGFHVVEIRKDEEDEFYWLHIQKEALYSPQTIFDQSAIFVNFANDHEITYDGWDVGPIKK